MNIAQGCDVQERASGGDHGKAEQPRWGGERRTGVTVVGVGSVQCTTGSTALLLQATSEQASEGLEESRGGERGWTCEGGGHADAGCAHAICVSVWICCSRALWWCCCIGKWT